MKEESKQLETIFKAEYKNGSSTITTKFDGAQNVFPVVMYSEKAMEKVREAQKELSNEKKIVCV